MFLRVGYSLQSGFFLHGNLDADLEDLGTVELKRNMSIKA